MSPDFEMEDIWKIIIGGAKLSRGYTIEGLTTTYFRRSTKASATLLQMGRWFGYRNGYRDLVRLYISRKERLGAKTLDLYEAFEAICRDEEAFRKELRRYSVPQPDGSRLTPREIPPLVQNTHPQLKPDQPNKMWNAKLTSRNFGGQRIAFGSASIKPSDLSHNAQLFQNIFAEFGLIIQDFGSAKSNQMAVSRVPHASLVPVLRNFKRTVETSEEKFFKDFLLDESNEISEWLVVLPQVGAGAEKTQWQVLPSVAVTTVERTWAEEAKKFTTVAEDRHRVPCYAISHSKGVDESNFSEFVKSYSLENHLGVILLYPIHPRKTPDNPNPPELSAATPAIGLEYFIPKNNIPLARFEAARPDRPDQIVVDIPGTEESN